jgi:hypothetical protein
MCLVLITTTALGHNETNSVLTCYNARVPDIKFTANSQFCNFVTWPAARLYDQSTFTYYDAGTPLSYQDHFDYAISLYVSYLRTIVGMNEEVAKEMIAGESSSCTEATQRLACTSAFPECPYGGSSAASVTTLPPCRL